MPYITPEQRKKLDPMIDNLFEIVVGKGGINYCITRLVHLWVLKMVKYEGKSYRVLSEGHSVLQDAAAEYYRTVMAPYENKKAVEENGPISRLDGGKPDAN